MRLLNLLSLLSLCAACAPTAQSVKTDPEHKVELNLSQLDADGLRGPADGKVAVAYEFAIPNNDECKARVVAIDHTI
jgi:hypothetical protein